MFEIEKLSKELRESNPSEAYPSEQLNNAYFDSADDSTKERAVEDYLSNIIESAGEKICDNTILVRFLDVVPDQSIMSKVQVKILSNKVGDFPSISRKLLTRIR